MSNAQNASPVQDILVRVQPTPNPNALKFTLDRPSVEATNQCLILLIEVLAQIGVEFPEALFYEMAGIPSALLCTVAPTGRDDRQRRVERAAGIDGQVLVQQVLAQRGGQFFDARGSVFSAFIASKGMLEADANSSGQIRVRRDGHAGRGGILVVIPRAAARARRAHGHVGGRDRAPARDGCAHGRRTSAPRSRSHP